MKIKEKVIEKSEEVLDKYFPKGDKRRGEALVLIAIVFNETLAEVMKVIYEEISILKDIHVEVDSQLDVLRNDIRDNVESVAIDGKAFSRTSDIDNSIDAKEEEIKKYFKKKIEELEQELKQKLEDDLK